MHVKNPAYTCASRKSSRSVLAISALVVFSAAALLVGLQHPTVALAKDGGSGGGNGLASLKTVAVPRPTNLARFIKDEKAAIALVGSSKMRKQPLPLVKPCSGTSRLAVTASPAPVATSMPERTTGPRTSSTRDSGPCPPIRPSSWAVRTTS